MTTKSTVSPCSRMKFQGPYAPATSALPAPATASRVSALRIVGTCGVLYVMSLKNARFVPAVVVSKTTRSGMVWFAGGSCASAGIGTSAVSFTSWYPSAPSGPRSVSAADAA